VSIEWGEFINNKASRRNHSWNLGSVNLLEHAVYLVFLRRVSGIYIFVHRLLMEHFALMDAEAGLWVIRLRNFIMMAS
jgi:hypothetical protein